MSKQSHWASCDRANECDNTDWWGHTACGLNPERYEGLSLEDNITYVTCKNCLKQYAKYQETEKAED